MNNLLLCDWLVSPRARVSKTVLDSVFHAVDSGFQVLDSSLCQRNLELCQWNFRIPWAVFRIPKPRIHDSRSKNFTVSGILIPLRFLFENSSITEIPSCFLQAVSLACFTFSRLTFINQISPYVRYRSGFRDPGIFAFGIRNPEYSCLLDSKSWALESAVHVKESGIPLMIGIPNPSSTEKESEINSVESRMQFWITWHGASENSWSYFKLNGYDTLELC